MGRAGFRRADSLRAPAGAHPGRHVVWRLFARPQPVPFAFGGEARPADYARAMADGGLLALVATLGLAQLSHETTPALAQVAFTSVTFFAIAALPSP